jgi:nitrogen-specific signal transduction histidine kinase
MDDNLEHRLNKIANNDLEQFIKDTIQNVKSLYDKNPDEQWYLGAMWSLHEVLDEVRRLKKEGYL